MVMALAGDFERQTVLIRSQPARRPATRARRYDLAESPRRREPALAISHRRHDAVVYRRRRLFVGGLLLLAVAAVAILAQLVQAGIGGGPLTATGAAGSSMTPVRSVSYVVRPGDTLWSIAAAIDPHGDERPLVDRLSSEVGDRPLYPGQVLAVPNT